jgi:hypothetical protein
MAVTAAFSRLAEDEFAEHARQIGIIAAQGSVLESEVELLFNTLLGSRYNVSKIIYYAMLSFAPRLNIIQNMIADNYHDDEDIARQWGQLRHAVDMAAGKRNRIVHAIWAKNPTTGALQQRSTVSSRGE